MSALPIPMAEFVAYLTIYPWYDPDRFVKYITHLDNTYLSEKAKQDEAKNKNSGGGGQTSSRNVPKRK